MKASKQNRFIIYSYHILAIVISTLCTLSCMMKSPMEKLQEKYNKEYSINMLDSILNPYIKIKWDSVNVRVTKVENSSTPLLLLDGYGISDAFGGEKFFVTSLWHLSLENIENITFPAINVYHKALGEIMYITGYDSLYNKVLGCAEFNHKLSVYKDTQHKIAIERKNATKLAYMNKTLVHFGMSADEYNNSDKGYRKNFIDGLIGNGAYEFSKPVFAKGKFVGIEVYSKRGRSCGHENILNNAELTNNRKLEGSIRFHSCQTNYVCKLYNLQIFQQTDGASGECSERITIWWNRYLKIYK